MTILTTRIAVDLLQRVKISKTVQYITYYWNSWTTFRSWLTGLYNDCDTEATTLTRFS